MSSSPSDADPSPVSPDASIDVTEAVRAHPESSTAQSDLDGSTDSDGSSDEVDDIAKHSTADTGSPEASSHDSADDSKAANSDEERVTVYTPESSLKRPGILLAGMVLDIWRSRELSWRLFLRNIRALYRQTLLGLFWAFLPPVAQTAIWVFLQQNSVVNVETNVSYVAFVLTGMILWQGFIDSFLAPLAAVNSGRPLLSKINFPRESLLAVSLGEVLFNLAIRSLLLIVVFAFFVDEIHWTLALAPLGMISLIGLGFGMGLILMPFGALYHDVSRFLTIATPFWMLLTPIVYPPPQSDAGQWLVWLNPVSPTLIATRDALLVGESAYVMPALITGLLTIPILMIGMLLYRLSMPILIERMNA